MYAIAIAVSFANHWVSLAIYVAVALMWLIPDRRIEKRHAQRNVQRPIPNHDSRVQWIGR